MTTVRLAAGIFLGIVFTTLVLILVWRFSGQGWGVVRSPQTGICYERQQIPGFLSVDFSMSPVDSKFCEEKP